MVEWVRCGPGFFAVITIVSGLEKCAGVLTHTNTSSHCMPTLIITYMARLNIDHQLHGNISYLYGKIEHWSSPSWQHWSSLIWQDWTLIITFMATLIITYMARLNIDHHLHGKLIITYIVRLNIDQHGNIDTCMATLNIELQSIIITYMTDKTSLINTGQLLSFLDIGMFNYMNLISWNRG